MRQIRCFQVKTDGRAIDPRTLILEELVPMAEAGLASLGFDPAERARYLGIITARAETGRNGAQWQRDHATRNKRDFRKLVTDYLEWQRSGAPVHQWVPAC